jgi:hypothetical protein
MSLTYRSPHKVIDHIISVLFAAEERRLTKAVNELCNANREAYNGEQLHGFHYQGRWYRYEDVSGALNRKVLHLSLFSRMDRHLADEAAVNMDKQMIRQTLFQLLDPCTSEQDMRDALPNCLSDTLGEIGRLPRKNEEAFTIRNNPRAVKQYEKIKPKLELYSAARLLY